MNEKEWSIKTAKVGDVIVVTMGGIRFISFFGSYRTDDIIDLGGCTVYRDEARIHTNHSAYEHDWYDSVRLATEKEKNRLFKELKKAGLTWDDKNHCIIKQDRWLPEPGDPIWRAYFTSSEQFHPDTFGCSQGYQPDMYDFPTREECQLYCDKMNVAINDILDSRKNQFKGR